MATDIKRVRFFDGQFLKEGDFQAEQRYHSHLRRRMNYLLFGQSGVVPMTPDDLALEVVSAVDKTFRVKAGMAIGQNVTEEEGREILLTTASAPIDLDSVGILTGETAVVSLHLEEETTDLSTEGEVSQDTRVHEKAVINVGLAKPATPANGDPYVQLGTIAYDTMALSTAGREVALLRSSLIAAAPVPTITGVTGVTSAASGSVIMNIIGTNLNFASTVTFPGDPAVTAAPGLNTATSLTVTVSVGAGATPGPKAFQVSTPSGTAFSPAGVVFTVLSPVPTVTGVVGTPMVVVGGAPITMVINGTNLTGASAVTFSGATGVTVLAGIVATATTVTIQVQAAVPATAGLKAFQVTTPGGTATSPGGVGLTVLLLPTISGVSGTTTIVANGVATPGFVINGTNLTGATVSFPSEPTMIVGPTVATATSVTITLTAPLGMTPGLKLFRVTTAAGFVDSSGASAVTVTAPVPAPTITSIDVHNFPRLADTNAIITGTNLLGGTVSVSGTGVTVTPNGAATATSLPITVHVTNSATTGARTFSVTTGGGTANSNGGVPAQVFTVTL